MMSWIKEGGRSWLEKFCINVLKCGSIPRHVAFIMDGNRRYAKKLSVQSIDGHIQGFEKLTQTLEWCLDLGIEEVTLYAFSIENFKRSQKEVDGLMALAREKFQHLLREREKLDKYGICVKIIGNLQLLPVDLQQVVADVVISTQHNDRAHLNVCLAYTSRDEMTTAIQEIANGVQKEYILPSDVSEDLFEKCLYIPSEPDLLIRTSGETRLSDFLLWQSSYSVLSFLQVLWPEFSIWYLFAAVLYYQRNCVAVRDAKQKNMEFRNKQQEEQDCEFICQKNQAKATLIEEQIINVSQSEIQDYRKEREHRISNFLTYLKEKRYQHLLRMKRGETEQVVVSNEYFR